MNGATNSVCYDHGWEDLPSLLGEKWEEYDLAVKFLVVASKGNIVVVCECKEVNL